MTGFPSAEYISDLTNADPGRPMNAATWSIVFAPGVWTSSYAGQSASARGATLRSAFSRFAA